MVARRRIRPNVALEWVTGGPNTFPVAPTVDVRTISRGAATGSGDAATQVGWRPAATGTVGNPAVRSAHGGTSASDPIDVRAR